MNRVILETAYGDQVVLPENGYKMIKNFLVLMALTFSVQVFCQNLGLKWSKRIDSVNDLYLTDIESDAQSNIYVIGQFSAPTDVDPGAGITTIYANGDEDVFVAKYSANGNFLWVKSFGGFGLEMANSLSVNDNGDVAIFFQTEDYIDLDPATSGNELTFSGDGSILLWLSTNGQLLGGKSWSGSINTQDNSNQITLDNFGNTYVVGTPNNKFIKYNSLYQSEWEKTIDVVEAQSIVVDDFGDVYLATLISGLGYFLPQEMNGSYSVMGTNYNVMVCKFDPSGALLWYGDVGSMNSEYNARLETDGISKLFLAYDANGAVESSLFSTGTWSTYYGSSDVVLSCYSLNGFEYWTNVLGTTEPNTVTALTYSAQTSEIYIGTYLYPGFDGDPTSGNTPSAGPIYGYVAFDGSLSSWGERFMMNGTNGGSQTFHYSPYLKALENGRLIAGDRYYLDLDLLPGGATVNYTSPVYGLYLAAYGPCTPTSSSLNVAVCDGESYNFNGNSLGAGTYEFRLANAGGCDSLVQLQVTSSPTASVNRSVAACQSPYDYFGQAITSTGSYVFDWPGDNGCIDSTVNLYVHFVTLSNPAVSGVPGFYSLYATANLNGIYTFINCDDNQVIQQGASASCLIQNEGNYRIEFTQSTYPESACTIVSNCVQVGPTSVEQEVFQDFVIYPNPILEHESITLPQECLDFNELVIYDMTGRKVFESNQRKSMWSVAEMGLINGQYLMSVYKNDTQMRSKLTVLK